MGLAFNGRSPIVESMSKLFAIILLHVLLVACVSHTVFIDTPDDPQTSIPPAVSTPAPEQSGDRPPIHLPTHRRPPVSRKQQPTTGTPDQQEARETPAHPTDATPTIPGTVLLDETFFTIRFDAKLMLPRIVSYILAAENLKHNFAKRKDHFHADLVLPTLGLQSEGPESFDKG